MAVSPVAETTRLRPTKQKIIEILPSGLFHGTNVLQWPGPVTLGCEEAQLMFSQDP